MPSRKQIGEWGEAIAAGWLTEHGYTVRHRNWRSGHGELDVVAEIASHIHFVEVRTRTSDRHGTPQESISMRKRAKLLETARAYLAAHELNDVYWQMDAFLIDMDSRHAVARLDFIEQAFS